MPDLATRTSWCRERTALRLTEEETEKLVQCILRGTRSGNADAEPVIQQGQVACDRLRGRLEMLIGPLGVQALLNRALRLAQRNAPWLAAVHTEADGSLYGLDEAGAGLPEETVLGGFATLIRNLIMLLVDLIGDELAWGLLHENWSDPLPASLDSPSGEAVMDRDERT